MNISKRILSLIAICLLVTCMCACSSKTSGNTTSDEIDTSNTITESYDEEIDGAEIKEKTSKLEDFFGTWIATSEVAEYYYGNVTLTIKDGGKWEGIITDEDISGKWVQDGNTLKLSSELYNCTLFFSESGKLIMQEFIGDDPDDETDDDYLNTVLIKK